MCFSATVSFTASSVLLPAGVYSIAKAIKKDKRYLFVAFVPVFFAIQQAVEGIIWVYFGKGMPASAKSWSYVYLLFVFACWPFFIALCAYAIENNNRRRKMLYWFVLVGAFLSAASYLSIVTDFMPFDISVVAHSISYKYHAPAWLLVLFFIFYAGSSILPLLLSTVREMYLIGIMYFIALIASLVWYLYAFTSVWCFFAAAIAIYISWLMKNLGVQARG